MRLFKYNTNRRKLTTVKKKNFNKELEAKMRLEKNVREDLGVEYAVRMTAFYKSLPINPSMSPAEFIEKFIEHLDNRDKKLAKWVRSTKTNQIKYASRILDFSVYSKMLEQKLKSNIKTSMKGKNV